MSFTNRDVISINDFSKDELLSILKTAKQLEKKPQPSLLQGHIMAELFFEPSTRTRLSFVSAMQRLGGSVLGFSSTTGTSIQKGESLWDTVKMAEHYADVLVIRHPAEGAARLAAESSKKPVINAGDGANQHPTQTLLDLYTIQKSKGTLSNLNIAILGDLKFGRTAHSLVMALADFNPTFTFIAPDALQMPTRYLEKLKQKKVKYSLTDKMIPALKKAEIMYVTRIQKERFADPLEYNKYKGYYRLDKSLLPHMNKKLRIMHPLPRVGEIGENLDTTEHAIYFEQAANGIPIRQALLGLTLGKIK